jgi:hypothetical protein
MTLCFSQLLKKTLDVFGIHLVKLKINNFLVASSIVSLVIDAICWINPIIIFINYLICTSKKICNWMQTMITLQKHRIQGSSIIFVHNHIRPQYLHIPLGQQKRIRQRLLNLTSNIKDNMLWAFFSSYLLWRERKKSKTSQTSLLMLETKFKDNSKAIPKSSSIKLTKVDGFAIFFFEF